MPAEAQRKRDFERERGIHHWHGGVPRANHAG